MIKMLAGTRNSQANRVVPGMIDILFVRRQVRGAAPGQSWPFFTRLIDPPFNIFLLLFFFNVWVSRHHDINPQLCSAAQHTRDGPLPCFSGLVT